MENPSSNLLGPRMDFKFAFNDTDFSDRVLHIEILPDSLDSDSDYEGCDNNRKRKRLNLDHGKECSADSQVKTLHISSVILAANSPYFYKLFKNGMRESQQKDNVTLRINASEEAGLTELVNFMYNNTLSSTTASDLLGVLIVADKFEVTSCVKYCSELLQKIPMSQESAILYLELHSTVFLGEVVKPLTDAAKQYFVARFKDPFKCPLKDVLALPLCAIEVLLGSDGLMSVSENNVYDMMMMWARSHYPKLEERREILTKRLLRLIRFPYLRSSKLKEILVCEDFDKEQVSKLVLEALFWKVDGEHKTAANLGFIIAPRLHTYRPVKVVEFELLPRPHCVVYFDLNKQECAFLSESRSILCSQPFRLGGRYFQIGTHCRKGPQSSQDHFGFTVLTSSGSDGYTLDYEFAVMKNPSVEFQITHKLNNCTLQYSGVGKKTGSLEVRNAFGIPWDEFIADDNTYFIDGILHLRTQLTINNS